MRLKKYELYRLAPELDEFGQTAAVYSLLSTIALNVTLKDQTINNQDPRYIEATHIAIGRVNNIKEGDKITDGVKSYLVKQIVPSHRQSYILLSEVK